MNFSLNEVESTAKKAARGAGYPWGLAEESGKAMRWLASHGIDCCLELSDLLGEEYANTLPDHTPGCSGDIWHSVRALCPLITGTALADRAFLLKSQPISLSNVYAPVLIIPFAAFAAGMIRQPVTVSIDGKIAITDGIQLQFGDPIGVLAQEAQVALGGTIETPRKRFSRLSPDMEGWNALLQYAHKTYAPATEESRLKGAGAGLSDND